MDSHVLVQLSHALPPKVVRDACLVPHGYPNKTQSHHILQQASRYRSSPELTQDLPHFSIDRRLTSKGYDDRGYNRYRCVLRCSVRRETWRTFLLNIFSIVYHIAQSRDTS